jgi:uncharacterized protein YndB with AHSA1/START domain
MSIMAVQVETNTYTRMINVPPAGTYRAFTSGTAFSEWLSDGGIVSAHPQGRLHLWWDNGHYGTGEYTTLEPDKSLTFTWLARGAISPAEITVTFEAQDNKTLVTVTQHGAHDANPFPVGWQDSLENLQSMLEEGIDLRIYRRPMLGVTIDGEIDAKRAEKLGLPVTAGVEIGMAIPGMGAEAAGMQGGDVFVSLGGAPVTTFRSLGEAITPHRAGDTVEVGFYRGSEKHVVNMTFSARPRPDIPPTGAELADSVMAMYDQLFAEISEIVQGISDEVASHHPAEGEWNVKEVLAHLIMGDRVTLMYLSALISGEAALNFPDNPRPATEALIAVHPTVPDLLTELKRTWAEIGALVRAVPADFVARKSSYVRTGVNLLQGDFHPRSHYNQLREAIRIAQGG